MKRLASSLIVPVLAKSRMTVAQIKEHLRRNWRETWWGGMDCDRCPARKHSWPCATCVIWPKLVQDYRAGKLTKEVPFK